MDCGHSAAVDQSRWSPGVNVGKPIELSDNWDNRRVPSMNTSADQTQASLKRVADLLAEKKAQLWINHDNPQSLSQKHSPEYYD